jgi:PTS system nitrogen regulatory IIA component
MRCRQSHGMFVKVQKAVKASFQPACKSIFPTRHPCPIPLKKPLIAALTVKQQPASLPVPYNASMAQDDFDIDGLAAYLHMMPAAVQKLAERGKLPGRRIGGDWKFSSAEIHHWLENRIGLSDEEGLLHMEGALDRASELSDVEQISISNLLKVEAIEIPLEARTRGSVVGRMTEIAAQTHLLWDPAKMAEAVRVREEMHSTALDNGVALLHPRRPMPTILAEALLALGISPGGIPFGTNGRLTDIFFLICSTSDHEHLRILARLSRVINDQNFLAELRAAHNPAAVHRLIRDRESTVRDT